MFIPLNLADAKERKPVPDGTYGVTILEFEEAQTKEGKPQLIASLAVQGHEHSSPNIRHYIGIPSEKDSEDARSFKLLNIRRFQQLFRQDRLDGFDPDALVGESADVKVVCVDENGDAATVESAAADGKRVFNRLVLPFLKDTIGHPRTTPRPPRR